MRRSFLNGRISYMRARLIYIMGGTLLAGSLFFGGSSLRAAAQESDIAPVLFGSVIEVNGSTITVEGRRGKNALPTTYMLDAQTAQISEGYGLGSSELTASNLAVGDEVAVIGAYRSA
jgi:hypothetical protein